VTAGGKAEYNLTYQELLARNLGAYVLTIALPTRDGGRFERSALGQPLQLQQQQQQPPALSGAANREMRIDVRIKETNEISGVYVTPPQLPGSDASGNFGNTTAGALTVILAMPENIIMLIIGKHRATLVAAFDKVPNPAHV
jgi:hypothetical protein